MYHKCSSDRFAQIRFASFMSPNVLEMNVVIWNFITGLGQNSKKSSKLTVQGENKAGWIRQNAQDCSESAPFSKKRTGLQPHTGSRIECRKT